ncbi:hypothetical protein GCK32_011778 [Trichostrongylus colubriformis]|uniref:Uncharacterized protein n=1 Tax=Trichostrongylus colubriformis TaxID=6319 RepID=A0AAN8FGC8_TRICO
MQTATVVERAIALWKRNEYERYGCRLGFAISVICILVSLLLSAWSMGKMDLTALTVYCSATTNETADRITILCFIFCGIDVITLSGMAWLRTSNVAAMKGVHFSYVAYRTIYAVLYTVPYFTMISPILLWFIITKTKRSRIEGLKVLVKPMDNERDVYFNSYSTMWNKSKS